MAEKPTDPPTPELDRRFTHGLIFDIVEVLERHGYALPAGDASNSAMGGAALAIGDLVRAYEGRAPGVRSTQTPGGMLAPGAVQEYEAMLDEQARS